jgi:hypothetical protein
MNYIIQFFFVSDGTFHLWETNTWTSEPWSSSNGYVTVSSIFVSKQLRSEHLTVNIIGSYVLYIATIVF